MPQHWPMSSNRSCLQKTTHQSTRCEGDSSAPVGHLMQAHERFSILLVDDEPMVVRILSRILRDFKPLRFATSGRVALKLAREAVPDLVVLDVDMPEFS